LYSPFILPNKQYQLVNRDPRRNQPLVDWISSLPLEVNGDSAIASKFIVHDNFEGQLTIFLVMKSQALFGIMIENLCLRHDSMADKYVNLLFDNMNTGYAEVRIVFEPVILS
jgi:proteasome activator subunit 4